MYATKRRQRNFKRARGDDATTKVATGVGPGVLPPSCAMATSLVPTAVLGAQTAAGGQPHGSNPSKRHRERLNGELENVAVLLPYDANVIGRLDKLSVLRLAVSYLQAKTHFHVCLQRYVHYEAYKATVAACAAAAVVYTPQHEGAAAGGGVPGYAYQQQHFGHQQQLTMGQFMAYDPLHANENTVFKALGGFVLILNENGEIYYASDNIETYLGFHQSDILHQPVYDMIHSEDRDELRQQLLWNYSLPPSGTWQDVFTPDGTPYLERSASARFRCLLDNTCGFLRIDVRGRLQPLYGLSPAFLGSRADNQYPVLGLVAVCSPFVPPPNLDGPDTEPFLKTKHALDFAVCSVDAKARYLLELTPADRQLPTSFYALVHPSDAPCLAEAHKEVIKNGASGLLVYRLISTRSQRTYWLQSSCRLFYKNGKPESIGCTHRLLTEVEGSTLLEKRAALGARLLSFDDSLLQSPKLLQSTAALTNVTSGGAVPNAPVATPKPSSSGASQPATGGKKKAKTEEKEDKATTQQRSGLSQGNRDAAQCSSEARSGPTAQSDHGDGGALSALTTLTAGMLPSMSSYIPRHVPNPIYQTNLNVHVNEVPPTALQPAAAVKCDPMELAYRGAYEYAPSGMLPSADCALPQLSAGPFADAETAYYPSKTDLSACAPGDDAASLAARIYGGAAAAALYQYAPGAAYGTPNSRVHAAQLQPYGYGAATFGDQSDMYSSAAAVNFSFSEVTNTLLGQ